MTEDEAKTKWCPMVEIRGFDASNPNDKTNRPQDGYSANCIGSACVWGCDADGKWRGHCGVTPLRGPASIPPAPVVIQSDVRRIAGGVYSNPQPGDADFPAGQKTDIGSGC